MQTQEIEVQNPKKPTGTASVVRALQLLNAFTGGEPSMGVSDVAEIAQLPTSTAHRLLSHLVKGGLVAKDGPRYYLSERLFELGNHVSHSHPNGLRNTVAPFLGEIFKASQQTTHLAVLDGAQIVIIDKISGLTTYQAKTLIGSRHPTVCTALGKAMLAFHEESVVYDTIAAGLPRRTRHSIVKPDVLVKQLAEIRRTRLSFDREESTLGQSCIASPIVSEGRVLGALSITGRTQQIGHPQQAAMLTRATMQIQSALASQVAGI